MINVVRYSTQVIHPSSPKTHKKNSKNVELYKQLRYIMNTYKVVRTLMEIY